MADAGIVRATSAELPCQNAWASERARGAEKWVCLPGQLRTNFVSTSYQLPRLVRGKKFVGRWAGRERGGREGGGSEERRDRAIEREDRERGRERERERGRSERGGKERARGEGGRE
eukprot:6178053-Pleurochrysis_carterae.AAC.5